MAAAPAEAPCQLRRCATCRNRVAHRWRPPLKASLWPGNTVGNSKLAGRIFDFLGWSTAVPSINISDDINVANQAGKLISFLTQYPHLMASLFGTINVQAIANMLNASGHPARGLQFLGDTLSGFLDAIQGTVDGKNSDRTDVAHRVGAIGWPDSGLPGRGIEIALPPESAFTYLQTALFDLILQQEMVERRRPLIGYLSIRVVPPTSALLGMQQFSPYSIMIEVVGYRSPEANVIFDRIQSSAFGRREIDAMLHWGLENDQRKLER
ncbi:MAG: hypothetical protein JNL21_29380 [Myxococcales bacterium]|nr:hypothetical protein [Myxococcales bacterium]